ncbi:hypothetical protein HWI79_1235 [Cryptosporidium felis]|nr:hypothetical protein HWI79_1235 [Cryptosporidium felis]
MEVNKFRFADTIVGINDLVDVGTVGVCTYRIPNETIAIFVGSERAFDDVLSKHLLAIDTPYSFGCGEFVKNLPFGDGVAQSDNINQVPLDNPHILQVGGMTSLIRLTQFLISGSLRTRSPGNGVSAPVETLLFSKKIYLSISRPACKRVLVRLSASRTLIVQLISNVVEAPEANLVAAFTRKELFVGFIHIFHTQWACIIYLYQTPIGVTTV